ncbi:MAG TPA: hypothetical protein VFB96_17690, partial [Pirellulaceae bacterium]|nr:hypothetical protein [Pirellulaceae bacterium]
MEMDAPGGIDAQKPSGVLTGPWHVSSRLFGLTVFLLLAVCNLPGQEVRRLKPAPAWDEWELERQVEHGWPVTVVSRTIDETWSAVFSWDQCWTIWENKPQLHFGGSIVNAACVLVLPWICGLAFEAWRRQRKRLWQLHLRDLMVGVVLVSAVGAWYLREQRQSRYLSEMQQSRVSRIDVVESSAGGVTWIRKLGVEERFNFLDRPVAIEMTRRGLVHLPELTDVQHVHYSGIASDGELRRLKSLPQLCFLDLSGSVVVDEHGKANILRKPPVSELQLPRLAGLRSLDLSYVDYRVRGLEKLRSVEMLNLTGAFVDDAVLNQAAALPRLKRLNLSSRGFDETPTSLALLPSLARLEELALERSYLREDDLKHIGGMSKLKRLSVARCTFLGGHVWHLAGMESLEHLDLSYTYVTHEALKSLARLPQLQTLNVTGAPLSRLDAPQVRQLFSRC